MQTSHIAFMAALGISSNLDCLAIGISYGARNVRIPFSAYLLITGISGLGTLLSMLIGKSVCNSLGVGFSMRLGAFVIIAIGIWIFLKEAYGLSANVRKGRAGGTAGEAGHSGMSIPEKIRFIIKNPLSADMDGSGVISFKEGAFLGLALTINNLTDGIGAGLLGLSPFFTAFLVVIFCVFLLRTGVQLGRSYIHLWLGSYSGVMAGALLILTGVIMVYTSVSFL